MAQGFSDFSADAVTYIAEKTLMVAKKAVIFHQFGQKAVLPSGNSKTFQYTRYDRLALPLSPLSDGVTPTRTDMSISTVTATADQWGAYLSISDVADLTIKHPVMQKGIELMGLQAAETVDREIIKVLLAGTAVNFPGSVIKRSSLADSNVLTSAVVRSVVSGLRSNGAHEFDGSMYMGVVDPAVEQDLNGDTTFVNAASYSNIKVLQNGEIGSWLGVRWMRSNNIPVLYGLAQSAISTPAGGSFAAANYRVSLAGYDKATGFLVSLEKNTAVTFAASDKLTVTTPNLSNRVYKIFVGLAGGGLDDIMYQGVETLAGTGFIAHNTAAEVLAPPTSGESIAGSDIPTGDTVVNPTINRGVHFSWVFGKEAFAVIDLQKLQSFITPKQASDSDPLVQRRKAGWKLMFKSVICNQNFMKRIETGSAY